MSDFSLRKRQTIAWSYFSMARHYLKSDDKQEAEGFVKEGLRWLENLTDERSNELRKEGEQLKGEINA